MADITITLSLFGAFRKHGKTLAFSMPAGCNAEAIKQKLSHLLGAAEQALIHDSVLANDNEIMESDAVLTKDSALAILPPVCGG